MAKGQRLKPEQIVTLLHQIDVNSAGFWWFSLKKGTDNSDG
jgi:hypothetical protein